MVFHPQLSRSLHFTWLTGIFFSVPDIRSDQYEYGGKINILTPQQPNIIIRNFSEKMTFFTDYFGRPLSAESICWYIFAVARLTPYFFAAGIGFRFMTAVAYHCFKKTWFCHRWKQVSELPIC